MAETDTAGADGLRGATISGQLRTVIIGHAQTPPGKVRALALITSGDVVFSSTADGTRLTFTAPQLCLLPWEAEARLTFPAGAVGQVLLIGTGPLSGAMGTGAETAELQSMTERRIILSLTERPALTAQIRRGMAAILEEQAAPGPAARAVIEAELRILLIHIWRAYDVAAAARNPRSPAEKIYNNFISLRESHFRDRWPVAAYARALGVSRDRLGDICNRVGGAPPKALLHARAGAEARRLLEHSTLGIEQIAGHLGFASGTQFSRFFHQHAGERPSAYRRRMAPDTGEGDSAAGLHAWP